MALVVFVVGAASLGAEIAAARLLAPYFGASTVVWANTIAVVLVALSAGYWLGGRLAARRPRPKFLYEVILVAGIALATVPLLARPFLGASVDALASVSVGAAVGSLLGVLVLIAGPVLLLGAVAPYAVQLSVRSARDSGPVAGRLYAISTAGSLVGTFLSALVLIPLVGTQRTFIGFGLALTTIAWLGLRGWWLLAPVSLALLLALPAGGVKLSADGDRVIYETETPYQYARVVEESDGSRRLELNEGVGVHSLYRPDSYLTDDVWDDFLVLPRAVLPRPLRRVAILGNGAGTVARAYGRYFPATHVEGVEIDGRLTAIGRRYFGLGGPRLQLVVDDARPYLRVSRGGYDAIFVEAYRQPYIPFYLTTREFFSLARQRLARGGVVIVNVAHPVGDHSLERVLTATLRTVFPAVARDPATSINTLLIGSSRPASRARLLGAARSLDPELPALALAVADRLAPPLAGGEVYTDDRAPVEWLIDTSIVKAAARGERP
jgi:spermidine synthase